MTSMDTVVMVWFFTMLGLVVSICFWGVFDLRRTPMEYKGQWDVPSSSGRRNTTYKVSQRHDGNWECSCMNWTRTVPRKPCKHILTKQLELLQASSTPAPVKTVAAVEGRLFRRAHAE
jgi:hypothetical protein